MSDENKKFFKEVFSAIFAFLVMVLVIVGVIILVDEFRGNIFVTMIGSVVVWTLLGLRRC